MAATPWAILLCKFSDVSTEPYLRSRYEEIFTSAGAGKFNMVDFFRDMSHGHVDLSGSRVFGWYTLEQKQSDYKGRGDNPKGRDDMLGWARQAAAKAGDDLSGFFNIVVTTNASVDLFGGIKGAFADDGRKENGMTQLSPSLLGQEMGHGYGLNHSRIDGSEEDRQDRWDVMSTADACFMARHPVYAELDDQGRPVFLIGPGLNAANMWGMGWLDLTRTWTTGWDVNNEGTVQLRPLHRPDLQGYLCARIADFFIEFRMNELWDARFPAPVILVHDYPDGHSYIHRGKSRRADLLVGDSFRWGSDPSLPVHGAGFEISVTDIDANARTATIQYELWSSNVPGPVGPGIPFGGVTNDGGGWVIVNGRVTPVPPRSPEFTLLELIAEARAGQGIRNGVARGIALSQAYEAIGGIAAARTAEIQSYREPAPASMQVEQTERDSDRPGGEDSD
jgi:hypothetical protein